MTEYHDFYSELGILQRRLKRADRDDSSSPAEVRELERTTLSLIDNYSGPWLTYPIMVEGEHPECTAVEAEFLRRHHRAKTEICAISALQRPGEQAMTREEFTQRLRHLRSAFTWLNSNIPPRFNHHLSPGAYSSKLDHVDQELKALGTQPSSKQAGCYVATAVYGSYDAAPVLTLRRFRDERLATTMTGRAFISFYYAASPSIAKRLERATVLNHGVRRVLDVVVSKLDERGFADDRK